MGITNTSHWDEIHNPVTGERVRFLGRDDGADAVIMEFTFPAGGRPVMEHCHPGWENFEVLQGTLHLIADRQLHQLGPGDQFTVTQEFHFPANREKEDAVVVITASPAAFFERGIRAAFGIFRDSGVTRSGFPRDLLGMALATENGALQFAGPPRWLWVSLMTALSWLAVLARKRRKLERYWPPELERPWKTRRSGALA